MSKSLDLKKSEADKPSKGKISFIIGGLAIIVLIVSLGLFFWSKGPPTGKKSSRQMLVEKQKAFPTDPIEILRFTQQLQKTSKYRLSSNLSRKVTGQDEQTMQQVQDTDGSNLRNDSFKDGLLYTRLLKNNEGVWQCDFLTPQDSEKPVCYRFAQKSTTSETPLNLDQLSDWQKKGLVTLETKKDTRLIDGKERPCQYVRYDLKKNTITQEVIQPLISKNNLTFSDEELKNFIDEFSKVSLTREQCFDYEVGVPLSTHSITTFGDNSVEDTSYATSLLTDDAFMDQMSLTLITKGPADRDDYFKTLLPSKDMFLAITSTDKLVIVKNGKVTTFNEVYRPLAITLEGGTPIVGTLLKGVLKYEKGKWIPMRGGEDVGSVKAFVTYQGAVHAVASGGIFKLVGDKWEKLYKLTTKEGTPSDVLLDNDTIYYLTPFNGLYRYKNGELKHVLGKDKVPYGMKFFKIGSTIYLSSNTLFSRFTGDDLKTLAPIKEYGTFLNGIEYKGKLYFSTTRGIYTEESDGIKLMPGTDKLVDIDDFAIFRDELYAGGETGVYVLRENAWKPIGDPGQFNEVFDLYVYKDALYAGDMLYLGRWDGARWELLRRDNVKSFFELDGALYVKTETGSHIERLDFKENSTFFEIPTKAERKILN